MGFLMKTKTRADRATHLVAGQGYIQMKLSTIKTLLATSFLTCAVAAQAYPVASGDHPDHPEGESLVTPAITLPLSSGWFQLIYILNEISNSHIHGKDPDLKMVKDVVNAYLKTLDPHSALLDEDDLKKLKAHFNPSFSGIGIQFTPHENGISVNLVLPDGPSERAGLKNGDIITRVNDTPIKGLSSDEVVGLLRGENGTAVSLTIERNGQRISPISVTRGNVVSPSVSARMIDGTGYIQILNFNGTLGEHFKKAVETLKSDPAGAPHSWIMDLSYNPGGELKAAIALADSVLDDEGVIVRQLGRDQDENKETHATPGDILNGQPLVVLVNRGSASASEVVAGTLQGANRAMIIGTKTFGKGSVQTIYDLTTDFGIKLTTGLYETRGGPVQGYGVTPDINVTPLRGATVIPDSVSESNLTSTIRGQSNFTQRSPQSTCSVIREDLTLDNVDSSLRDSFNKPHLPLICALDHLKRSLGMTPSGLTRTAPYSVIEAAPGS